MKKLWEANECPKSKWVITAIVGLLIGMALSIPWELYKSFSEVPSNNIIGLLNVTLPFLGMFIGFIISLKIIAKTSLRDFIFGKGGKFNSKQSGLICILFIIGFVLSVLLSIGNIQPSGISMGEYIPFLLLSLVMVTVQIAWEEFFFRGIFIRFACKNNISMTKGAIISGIISSLLFMALHVANPEVYSVSGMQIVFAIASYFLSGACLYCADIYFRSLTPGLIMHWINNMVAFVILTTNGGAVQTTSLFIDNSSMNGYMIFLGVVLLYAPLFVYIALKKNKSKRNEIQEG